jgi:pilus assembly protein CpaF
VVFVARAPSAGADDDAVRDAAAFGVLADVVARAGATDVFVNPDGSVWCDTGEGAAVVDGMRLPPDEARELAVRLVSLGGRHVDEATPAMDVRLGDGVRVHAVLPPVSPGGAALSIRLQRTRPLSARELAEGGMFADVPLDGIRDLVRRRANLRSPARAAAARRPCSARSWPSLHRTSASC